jgi:hypothetical protein
MDVEKSIWIQLNLRWLLAFLKMCNKLIKYIGYVYYYVLGTQIQIKGMCPITPSLHTSFM